MATVEGQPTDQAPSGVHSSWVAAKEQGYTLREFCTNGVNMAKAQIAFQKKYDFDVVHLENGVGPLAEAIGCPVIYPRDGPPVVKEGILDRLKDIDALELPDPHYDGKLPELIKATRLVKKEFGDEVFIIGEADQGPFNLAAQLRGIEKFMMDLTKPHSTKALQELMEFTSDAVFRLAKAQIEAGAHATCIGESFASPDVISPNYYREFVSDLHKELGKKFEQNKILWALHICGDTTDILDCLDGVGASILEIDYKTDLKAIKQKVTKSAVLGTINPSTFLKEPEALKREVDSNIEQLRSTQRFILHSGCSLPKETPSENLSIFRQMVKYT